MGVELGTSSGFVESAPDADPGGIGSTIDARSVVTHDTTSGSQNLVTEMGWWCDTASQEANFEIGIYESDGATVPGEAGTLTHVDTTNAKGTTAGWKVVTGLNWAVDVDTVYWLGIQLDNVSTQTYYNRASSGGTGLDYLTSQTALTNPYGGGALYDVDGMAAVYAVIEESATGTNIQINVGDVHKEIPTIQINVGDSFKAVASIQENVGDAWKTVF